MLNQSETQGGNRLYERVEKVLAGPPGGGTKTADGEVRELVGELLQKSRELEWQLHELDEAKAELERAHKHAADLFEFAPVGYFILDAGEVVLSANTTACDMLGLPKSKLPNTDFYSLLEPESHAAFRAYLSEMTRTGQRLSTEVKMRHADGRVFDAQLQTVVLYDNSRVTYRVSVADITERKKHEEELRASERRFRLLFDNMLDGFARCRMVYDDQGRPVDFVYLDVNKAFEKLTGLKGIVGKKVSEVFPGINKPYPELFETYGRVAASGVPEEFEIEFKPLDSWLCIPSTARKRETLSRSSIISPNSSGQKSA